jgi:hypothetical protein
MDVTFGTHPRRIASNVAFVACLRGPGLEASETAVRAILETARLR